MGGKANAQVYMHGTKIDKAVEHFNGSACLWYELITYKRLLVHFQLMQQCFCAATSTPLSRGKTNLITWLLRAASQPLAISASRAF